jgi:hypothetical protein
MNKLTKSVSEFQKEKQTFEISIEVIYTDDAYLIRDVGV